MLVSAKFLAQRKCQIAFYHTTTQKLFVRGGGEKMATRRKVQPLLPASASEYQHNKIGGIMFRADLLTHTVIVIKISPKLQVIYFFYNANLFITMNVNCSMFCLHLNVIR